MFIEPDPDRLLTSEQRQQNQREWNAFIDSLWAKPIGRVVVVIGYVLSGIPAVAIAVAVYGVIAFAVLSIPYVIASRTNAILFGVPAVLATGGLLYALRQRKRVWYGSLEIVFGGLIAAFTISKAGLHKTFIDSLTMETVLGMASSCYIVVRGIDNIAQGRNQTRNFQTVSDEAKASPNEAVNPSSGTGVS